MNTTAIRATFKGHGKPVTLSYFGAGEKPSEQGTVARVERDASGFNIVDQDGNKLAWMGVASKFWAAPVEAEEPKAVVAAEATPAKTVTAKVEGEQPAKKAAAKKAAPAKTAEPAKKAAPAKVVPATVKEMTREQKRAVAAVLIERAGELLDGWKGIVAASGDFDDDLTGVSAKVAGELIGSWLSYCPGNAWHKNLGPRPRG